MIERFPFTAKARRTQGSRREARRKIWKFQHLNLNGGLVLANARRATTRRLRNTSAAKDSLPLSSKLAGKGIPAFTEL